MREPRSLKPENLHLHLHLGNKFPGLRLVKVASWVLSSGVIVVNCVRATMALSLASQAQSVTHIYFAYKWYGIGLAFLLLSIAIGSIIYLLISGLIDKKPFQKRILSVVLTILITIGAFCLIYLGIIKGIPILLTISYGSIILVLILISITFCLIFSILIKNSMSSTVLSCLILILIGVSTYNFKS